VLFLLSSLLSALTLRLSALSEAIAPAGGFIPPITGPGSLSEAIAPAGGFIPPITGPGSLSEAIAAPPEDDDLAALEEPAALDDEDDVRAEMLEAFGLASGQRRDSAISLALGLELAGGRHAELRGLFGALIIRPELLFLSHAPELPQPASLRRVEARCAVLLSESNSDDDPLSRARKAARWEALHCGYSGARR